MFVHVVHVKRPCLNQIASNKHFFLKETKHSTLIVLKVTVRVGSGKLLNLSTYSSNSLSHKPDGGLAM